MLRGTSNDLYDNKTAMNRVLLEGKLGMEKNALKDQDAIGAKKALKRGCRVLNQATRQPIRDIIKIIKISFE
jgi:hypothetical protein